LNARRVGIERIGVARGFSGEPRMEPASAQLFADFFLRVTPVTPMAAPSVCNLRKAEQLRSVTRWIGFFSTHFSTQLLKSSKINLPRTADCLARGPRIARCKL
jgi:hypothetical protein